MTQTRLKDIGWHAHFQAQLSDQLSDFLPVRVLAVHRDALEVVGDNFEGRIRPPIADNDDQGTATTGDWLLLDPETKSVKHILDRRSLFKRKSAGSTRRVQLIAANVDTLLLVTSANFDFNVARLERYLALAAEAEVTPLVIITKSDLVEDISPFVDEARSLMRGLIVEPIDARNPNSLKCLQPWFAPGQTLALIGSSGVGKSTILNTIRGEPLQHTAEIRETDSRGRHTTTGRSLHLLPNGAWLMDTPGMRELQIVDAAAGLDEVFSDIAALATTCRFTDCQHHDEPGCAIRQAIETGAIDPDRLRRYAKLQREEHRNSESIAEARARSRKFGKQARHVFEHKLKNRDW